MFIMARKPRTVSVYNRIEEKRLEINNAELVLAKLNEELQTLYDERDQIEMETLFKRMRENGLTLDKAIELLQNK